MMCVFLWGMVSGCEAPAPSDDTIVVVGGGGAMGDAALVDGPCPTIDDGVCDEPGRCPLGTDELDCVAACGDPTWLPFVGAACHHRGLSEERAFVADGPPLVGVDRYIDETLPAKDADGRTAPRHFRVFVPPGLPPAAPMVLMLPGNRVSHYSLPEYTELDSAAASAGFVVVYVEQPWRNRTFSWSWYTDWDWAGSPGTNPDLRFLTSLVEYLVDSYPVDPARVYVAGHSRGGAMSVIAALELPHLFAGAIPQSGFVEFGYFDRVQAWDGPRRAAFYFMHGALDDDVCVDCRPGGQCGIQPARQCRTTAGSDAIVAALRERGWTDENLRYARPERVAHRYQPWLNAAWWDFMRGHRIEEGGE